MQVDILINKKINPIKKNKKKYEEQLITIVIIELFYFIKLPIYV